MAKPCLYMYMYDAKYQVNIKSCTHVKHRSFKYVNLILRKENLFRENWLTFLGIGEKLNFLKAFGERRQNTFRT